jgi:glycosyltransferase involved in cell wall biosynthesis
MKIVHLIPGSGGTFYCENCVRDSYAVRALEERGHDVLMVPMYLPLYGHEAGDDTAPLFFGGINTWLMQHAGVFRSTPRWVNRVFDAPWLLKWAASKAGTTRASSLGDMTVSMLRGQDGRQAGELERLASFLEAEGGADIIHLSNALLLGMARTLRERTGAAVVCTLQDEAPWIDSMGSPWAGKVWDTMAEKAADADAFISVSNAYADEMEERLALQRDKLHVVHIGIEADSYPSSSVPSRPPVLGYMARMSEGCGLGHVVEAFIELKAGSGFEDLKLMVTGGKPHDDDRFVDGIKETLEKAGVMPDVTFVDHFHGEARRNFLSQLTVLSVPGEEQSAFGLYLLEAMAAGVPVVQPDVGGFRELVDITGGGIIVPAGDQEALVEGLGTLLSDNERARELGRRALEGVGRHFSLDGMIGQFVEVYHEAAGRRLENGV